MAQEELLVERRGNFRYKDRILGIDIGLIAFGSEAVHAVARFMRKCEHIVQCAVIVHENVGHAVVAAARIGARAFAGIFIDVDPAIFYETFCRELW